MKHCVLLLLVFASVHGAPTGVQPASSCKDPATKGIAEQAIEKINLDRNKGYIFSLERVSNVFQKKHGETGVVYYLTIDVLETNCHVLSKKNWKDCQTRSIGEHPVYGQCKVAIYVNRPKRIVQLYKYSCNVRPVTASKITKVCPDCPTMLPLNNAEVEKTMKMGLEKFNNESTLANYFGPLEITRATMQGGIANFVNVEFTIQETVCSNHTDVADISKCNLMTCEFAHKGFCKASHASNLPDGSERISVECEIYEPEAAQEEKKHHLDGKDHHHENIGGRSISHDHSHDHTAVHSHPPTHDHDHAPGTKHDHKHKHKDKHTHDHNQDSGHHHTHEHDEGHGIAHGHAHSHEHSHDHDHAHAHHGQAHNHTLDQGFYSSHHNYGHSEGETHEHDHEVALDHEHKHGHLHEHEHHHHHHLHPHDEKRMRKPEGTVHVHPALDQPTILPFFPDPFDKPDTDVSHPGHPEPHKEKEPTIGRFPTGLSPNCPADFQTNMELIKESYAEDPLFKIASPA